MVLMPKNGYEKKRDLGSPPPKKRKVLQIIHLYRKNEPLRKQRGSFMKLNQMAYCNNLETICGVWFA